MRRLILTLLSLIFCTEIAHANELGATLTANHTPTGNVQVRQVAPLRFGSFTNAHFGSVTVDPRGGRRASGDVALLGGGESPAEFELTGEPGAQVMVLLPASLALNGSGSDLTVTDLRIKPDSIITLDATGKARIQIGGTLELGTAKRGAYNGFFSITAEYIR